VAPFGARNIYAPSTTDFNMTIMAGTTAVANSNSSSNSEPGQVRRRTFALFGTGASSGMRFQCTQRRLVDAILDCIHYTVESFVYVIGPFLIVLALGIIGLLSYTFFHVVLPMLSRRHHSIAAPYRYLILTAHCLWVVFVLVNILFNYACCVLQKHVGPHYDRVVRELAIVTDFQYPETADDVANYRREFQDKMVLRMRRRRQREVEVTVNCEGNSGTNTEGNGNATKRRLNQSVSSENQQTVPTPTQQQPIRGWMLMGPFEWGFCSVSNQPKPPRSHYDHVSSNLVLNLDHYCPWMFNASK
jgi:palmitoyltransferase